MSRNSVSSGKGWGIPIAVVAVGFALWDGACQPDQRSASPSNQASSGATLTSPPGLRISMEALHRLGGVPVGWKLTPPQGDPQRGRDAFERFACYKCHSIQGESFPSPPSGPGPDLTGMGAHHPPGYFVEAILNPNAVLIESPDYLQEDGTSRMPTYPDMTLAELADLVAYLMNAGGSEFPHAEHHAGAGDPGAHAHHHPGGDAVAPERLAYLARVYRADEGTIDRFYRWFDEQRYAFVPGLVRIETYASRERTNGELTLLVLLGFENDGALHAFVHDVEKWERGSFLRPATELLLQSPALYRAIQMSMP